SSDFKLEHSEDIQLPRRTQAKKLPGFQSQPQPKKVTGFQFAPLNPSEVLITSTDSRIRIYNRTELLQKYRGFRNTGSQISACFTADGKYVISASEDSQVYVWRVTSENRNNNDRKRHRITVQSHEHFQCKDVSVAIPWPGSIKNEPPLVELHSKRHSKRSVHNLSSTTYASVSQANSPSKEDKDAVASGRRNLLPPLPKKNLNPNQNQGSKILPVEEEAEASSGRIDPGIGVSDSFASSGSFNSYGESGCDSVVGSSASQSWSSSWSLFDGGGSHGAQIVQATAWGLVIVTASLNGEIRVYQNFGLPVKVSRQPNLF
ncbi:hypothetical protein M569_17612, partial [Genlisea aurea]